MKSPAEYIEENLATRPEESVSVVPRAVAEAAVQQALADAERYRQLLAKALRNAVAVPTPEYDGAIIPLSAQYWRAAARRATTSADAVFCLGEAYNHLVGKLYALQQQPVQP